MKHLTGFLAAASMAMVLPAAPAHAGGDITNFNVENCTDETIFVCSFDKTDSAMKIPYKAGRIKDVNNKDGNRKEFGCASLKKCKVIIGVSNKKTKRTLSSGMEAALSSGSAAAAVGGGTTAGVIYLVAIGAFVGMTAPASVVALGVAGGVVAVIGVGAGAAVAGIEIADGFKDGEVCNKVRKAAQDAGYKPKHFLKDGNKYQVIEQYATDENGNFLVNADGTAVLTYTTQKTKGKCPAALNKQLVAN